MIYHYSTIIQFAAAIYVTLSFDNILFKSLWSLDYASLINQRISRISLSASSKIEDKLKNCITANAKNVERLSRIRGCYCLVFAVVTLLYAGYEQGFEEYAASHQTARITFFFYVFLSILGFVLSWIYIKRLLHQFVLCFCVILVSFLPSIFDFQVLQNCDFFLKCVDNTQYLVLFLIIIPLVFQLIATWLFTDNYYYILSSNIKSEYELYIKSLNAKDSKEVPKEYMEAIGQSFFDREKNKTIDTKITNLSNVFQERLDKAVSIPSIWVLLSYAIRNILKPKVDELSLIQSTEFKGEEIVSSKERKDFLEKKVLVETYKPSTKSIKSGHKSTKFEPNRRRHS